MTDDSAAEQNVDAAGSDGAGVEPVPEATFPLPEGKPKVQTNTQAAKQSEVVENCWEIGRFDTEEQGKQLVEKMTGLDQVLALQKKAVQGEPDYWVAVIRPGTILFELAGVSEISARECFGRVAHKLPVKVRLVSRKE